MSLSPTLTEQLKNILREETYEGEAGTVNAYTVRLIVFKQVQLIIWLAVKTS